MAKAETLFRWKQLAECTIECKLNLERLFETNRQRGAFEARWPEFLASDPYNRRVYRKTGNILTYRSEQLIPEKTREKNERAGRVPLLLVFGNPATHSVASGMFFSFEGTGKEHRFWSRILKPAEVLALPSETGRSVDELNRQRREALLNLEYESRFCIGLAVIISMPSAPGGPWGGIAGVQKLLGTAAMRRLEEMETKRVLACARDFMGQGGALIAFQKNAWENLRSENDPSYDVKLARAGKLNGMLREVAGVPLFCVPPTRLAGVCSGVLKKVVGRIG